jgi:hypothetical protein
MDNILLVINYCMCMLVSANYYLLVMHQRG